MRTRPLGRTGLEVPVVGFGAWAVGGNRYGNSYGPTEDEVSLAAIKQALDLGANFLDTADVYGHGHSETLLGQALQGVRRDCVLATKVGGDFSSGRPQLNFRTSYLRAACEESLKRLKTDYLDLYQLHNPPLELIRSGDPFEAMEILKDAGKIRFVGVSIHAPEEGLAAIRHGLVDALQVVFNVFDQRPREELFAAAREKNVAIIAREPLANGFLTGKYTSTSRYPPGDIRAQLGREYISRLVAEVERLRGLEKPDRTLAQAALLFSLSDEAVSTSIPGAKTPAQARENCAAAEAMPLSENELAWLHQVGRRA